jgi:F0F1-type ATP synthase delta subunit
MRAHHYATAYYELLSSKKIDEKELNDNFLKTVALNGHAHLLPKIISALDRIIRNDRKKHTIEVVTAMPISESEVSKLLKSEPFSLAISPTHKRVERRTDESIVGGVKVRTSGMRIDASYKRALTDLYQSLILK